MLGKVTDAHERCLRELVITADQPGPVLRDFGMLLEFVGTEGVEAAGKYNLFAIRHIPELDERLTRPLRLNMKRPQIRSHPYLQGLNLLLRASGLSRVKRTGAKARLLLDPEMMVEWDTLNPTERYFNLLEAWLRLGRGEMVGMWQSIWDSFLPSCIQTWQSIPAAGRKFDLRKPQEVHLLGIRRDFYLLALMDLFGLMAVELPARPVMPWAPAVVKHTPFGDAVFSLLTSRIDVFLDRDRYLKQDDGAEDEEAGAEESAGPDVPRIGAWQPLFQPYFPEWHDNLVFPTPEFRGGIHILRVSQHSMWRRIAMPADATLGDLVSLILKSVNFDFDHLYKFTYRDQLGREATAVHPYMDEGPWADDIPVGTLPLEPGQSMELVYDFGDNWEFDVELERIEPAGARIKAPSILERHGKAPRQYPRWDE
jgi:hypothetical protein